VTLASLGHGANAANPAFTGKNDILQILREGRPGLRSCANQVRGLVENNWISSLSHTKKTGNTAQAN